MSMQKYVQWNPDSSFSSRVLRKNDGYEKTIAAGAYTKRIKTVTFAYMYLLNQKTYTNDIISTVKSNLHYLFLKKPLILICLVAHNLSILTMFAWSLLVTMWAGSCQPPSPPAHCLVGKMSSRYSRSHSTQLTVWSQNCNMLHHAPKTSTTGTITDAY
jgi:hypothetical protein